MKMAKPRCTSAASCPSTRPSRKLTTRVLRTFTHRILAEAEPPCDDCLPELLRHRLKLPDRWTAHPRDALPAARCRPAPAQRLPLARAVPPDLRGILLAGMRRRAEAQQGAHAAGHRLSNSTTACASRSKPCCRSSPPDAQKRVLKEIADDMTAAASHEPAAAGRCGQRQDHRGGRSRGHRHRKRLSGGGARAHRNPGRAARLLLQADSVQSSATSPCCSPARSPAAKNRSSKSWSPKAWCTSPSARTR